MYTPKRIIDYSEHDEMSPHLRGNDRRLPPWSGAFRIAGLLVFLACCALIAAEWL